MMNSHSDKSQVLNINLTISEDKLIEGSVSVLKLVRPDWDRDNIKFKIFTDGITNKLVGCFHDKNPDDVILVRVYGHKTDMLIDRLAETRNIQLLHAAGYAPRIYATFQNGLAYEYVPGVILTVETCRSPEIYPLVATMMANIHKLDCGQNIPREPAGWKKVVQFLSIIPTSFSDAQKQARFVSTIPSKENLQNEFHWLQSELEKLKSPVVFCHNDLLLANVIYNAEKYSVTFIDYEYSSYNFQAFDIGNHFSEFAGVEDLDFTRYPSSEFQKKWLKVYLEAYSGHALKKDIDCLYVQVNKFSLLSHFLWALWSLIQAEHSNINFDFLGYSSKKIEEYFVRKNEFLELEVNNL